MIIYLIFILTILAFVTIIMIKSKTLRVIASGISVVGLITAVGFMIGNQEWHWGMKQETSTTMSTKVYSALPIATPKNILIYQNVGTNKQHQVLVFRDSKTEKKATAYAKPDDGDILKADKTTATYKLANTTAPKLTVRTTYWVYTSKLMNTVFHYSGNGKKFVSKSTVLTLPKSSWQVMTKRQVKDYQQQLVELAKVQAMKASQGETSAVINH